MLLRDERRQPLVFALPVFEKGDDFVDFVANGVNGEWVLEGRGWMCFEIYKFCLLKLSQ